MREAVSSTCVFSLWNLYPQRTPYTPAAITPTIAAAGCTAISAMLVYREAPINQGRVLQGAAWPFSAVQYSGVLICCPR